MSNTSSFKIRNGLTILDGPVDFTNATSVTGLGGSGPTYFAENSTGTAPTTNAHTNAFAVGSGATTLNNNSLMLGGSGMDYVEVGPSTWLYSKANYSAFRRASDGSFQSGEGGLQIYAGSALNYAQIYARNVADTSTAFRINASNGTTIKFTAAGNGYWDGAADLGSADYAEYFEWTDGNANSEDRVGYSVVLDTNGKIRVATADDDNADIIGVVSGRPAVVGDNNYFGWEGKYQKDEFNRYIMTDVNVYSWTDEDGQEQEYREDMLEGREVPEDAILNVRQERALSPDYDETMEYLPRSERQEWAPIGLLGKLALRVGEPTGDRWRKLKDISDDVELWLVR